MNVAAILPADHQQIMKKIKIKFKNLNLNFEIEKISQRLKFEKIAQSYASWYRNISFSDISFFTKLFY